jgi:hypothetical protein
MNNNKNLFSKGRERLDTWKHLMLDNFTLFFSKVITPQSSEEKRLMSAMIYKLYYLKKYKIHSYYFIFAALIILFQVFGDGNHRTAQQFMKLMRANEITMLQMREINNLLNTNDYYNINKSPIKQMYKLINNIINILELKHPTLKKHQIN